MDPKFQSSFIPRKSAADAALPSRTAVSIFTLICVAFFVVAAVLAGLLFLWKQTLVRGNEALKDELDVYQAKLTDPNIQELIRLNDRIAVATNHLNSHLALSNLFEVLEDVTHPNVQWKNFVYENNDLTSPSFSMFGLAKGFPDVALQSDKVLADKRFVGPLFSDVSLGTDNTVSFSLKTGVAPIVISYKALIREKSAIEVTSSDTPEVEETSTTTTSTSTR